MKVIEKPWGKEEILEINNRYMLKKLTMNKGHRCSLQYHNTKQETIYVLSGHLKIISGTSQDNLKGKIYGVGEFVTIAPCQIHRMESVDETVYIEASTPEMDDVVRLVDDYKRVDV